MTSAVPAGGHASPYSTAGGGIVLEHAYGGVLLAALLQSEPVPLLGDDVTPVEVRFQQHAHYPVDDLGVVGHCPTGERSTFIAVRRNPSIRRGSKKFVAMVSDYVRMLLTHHDRFDSGVWRLGLAVAGPHPAAGRVAELGRIARKQNASAAFRDAVFARLAVNEPTRRLLRNLDEAVHAAACLEGIRPANDIDNEELTWRLLRALHVVELRLEGDDPVDRTYLVGRLKSLVGDAARAVDLLRHLNELAAGYAVAAARVDLTMLGRDLASRVRIGPPDSMPLDSAGDEEAVRDRLAQLPPATAGRVLAAWRDEPASTWRLVTALTSLEDRPTSVVAEWARHRPGWLGEAGWQVQLAAAELAVGYGGPLLAADLFLAVANLGANRRELWLARAAVLYDENDHGAGRDEALATLGPADALSEPYARAVVALLAGNLGAATRALDECPVDQHHPIERTFCVALTLRVIVAKNGGLLDRATVDGGLLVLAESLRGRWSAALGVVYARLLIMRASRGESPTPDADLRTAQQVAVRARDDRRRYRGNSAEATELACQAALMAANLRDTIALGTAGDQGATEDEAASPRVREFVAVAAIQTGDLDLARESARLVSDHCVRATLDAHLAEAERRDSQPDWRRAIELAGDNDEYLARALAGLARSGAEQLPRLEELASRHPEAASEIRAASELSTGKPGTAIPRLRELRRTSATAALHLAQAYKAIGKVDDQVRTLRDAADDFHEPPLRYVAAEVLTRAGRGAEAEAELSKLLATTAPDWHGRPDALRLAAQLASDSRRFDRASELLHAALQLEPDHTETRWALVRILVHRGDPEAAWTTLTSAPQPLDPSTIADARLWLHLNRRYGRPAATIAGSLRLLRRFSSSEQFSAFVVTNLVFPWAPPDELPSELITEARLEVERFFERWPESRYIKRLDASDIQRVVAQMKEMARPTEEELLLRQRLTHGILMGTLPLSLLAAAARRSYAEVVIRRGGGVLPARHPDPTETAACFEATGAVADRDVVIDVSAVAVLNVCPAEVQRAAMATFRRVISTDETMFDARDADESLALRSTSTWVYDDRMGDSRLDDISQAEADRLADDAAAIVSTLQGIPRYPRPTASRGNEPDALPLVAWNSIIDLAQDQQIAVWSDDPIQRARARQAGVSAISTPAIVDYLAHTGQISSGQHEEVIRRLIKGRIGDLPLNEHRLLELAEDDNWAPGCVAAALSRPAAWTDPSRAATFLNQLITIIRHRRHETIPDLLHGTVRAAALATGTNSAAASDLAARLLTITVHAARAQAPMVADLVTAARSALAEADDPDRSPSPDPLRASALLLRDAYAKVIAPDLATSYVLAALASIPEQDQRTVRLALLG
jgi:tetratricopeptide (TPR) repeat protein